MQPSPPATSPAFSEPGWWNDYIGIPFAWRGYDRDGVSCWGLVCLVYAEVAGIEVPRHDQLSARVEREGRGEPAPFLATFHRLQLEDARSGDLLHMRGVCRGRVSDLHCGLLTETDHVMHAQEGAGVSIMRYAGKQNQNRILGAYRLCPAT